MRILLLAASLLGAMGDTCTTHTGATRDMSSVSTTCKEGPDMSNPATTKETFVDGTGGCDVTQVTVQKCVDEAPSCHVCKDTNGAATTAANEAACTGTNVWTAVTTATNEHLCGACSATGANDGNEVFCPWSSLAADDIENCGDCSGTVGGVAPVEPTKGGMALTSAGWASEDICNATPNDPQNECGTCSKTSVTQQAGTCACANLPIEGCPAGSDYKGVCEAGWCNTIAAATASGECGFCEITHVDDDATPTDLAVADAANCEVTNGVGHVNTNATWNARAGKCVDLTVATETACIAKETAEGDLTNATATYDWVDVNETLTGGEFGGYCKVATIDNDSTPGTLAAPDQTTCVQTSDLFTNTDAVWSTVVTEDDPGTQVPACIDPTLNTKALCDAMQAAEAALAQPTATYVWMDAIPGTWAPAGTGVWTAGCGGYCNDNTGTTSETCGSCTAGTGDGSSTTAAACGTAGDTWATAWIVPGTCVAATALTTPTRNAATTEENEDTCGVCTWTKDESGNAMDQNKCGDQAGAAWVGVNGSVAAYCHSTGVTSKATCEGYTHASGEKAWIVTEADLTFTPYVWTSEFKHGCTGTDTLWTTAATGCSGTWTAYTWGKADGTAVQDVVAATKADCTGDNKVIVNHTTAISFGSVATAPTTGYTLGWNSNASTDGWTTTNTYFCDSEDCATCAKLESEGDAAPTPAPDSDDDEDGALAAAAATAAAVAGAAALLL